MLKLSKINLKVRLIVGFSIVPLIMIFLNVIGVQQVNLIDKELYNINEITSVKQRYAINFRGSVHDRAISIRDVILNSDPTEVKKSEDEIITLASYYTESAKKLDSIFKNQIVSDIEKELLQKIKEIEAKTLPIIEKTLKAKKENRLEDAHQILMSEAKPAFIIWLARINKFIDHQEEINTVDANAARKTASGYQNLMLILTGLSLLTAMTISFFVLRSIIIPLKKVAGDIDDSSKKISSVSEIISDSSKNLADGSNKQTVSIENISTAIEEMNQIVRQNAEASSSASQLAVDSRNSAKNGERVVQDMVGAIGDINDSNSKIMLQIDDSNRQMSEIVKVIAEIGEKTKIINDIVFQTKLLSFNASVEAARAGEHGKGFAVVAEEVGKLAQMSGDAAKEISDMLTSSSSKVESIVNETKSKVASLIDSGKEKISTGNIIAKQCAEVLKDIVVKVNSVTEMASEISGSLKEQSVGFSSISANISEMDKVIQLNSGLASENANTINSLNEQTIEMRNAYDELSILVDGQDKFSNVS